MSPRTDWLTFALGVFGLWVGACVALLVAWIALCELFAWRARRVRERGEARRVTAPRSSVSFARRLELEDVSWEGWPDRP